MNVLYVELLEDANWDEVMDCFPYQPGQFKIGKANRLTHIVYLAEYTDTEPEQDVYLNAIDGIESYGVYDELNPMADEEIGDLNRSADAIAQELLAEPHQDYEVNPVDPGHQAAVNAGLAPIGAFSSGTIIYANRAGRLAMQSPDGTFTNVIDFEALGKEANECD